MHPQETLVQAQAMIQVQDIPKGEAVIPVEAVTLADQVTVHTYHMELLKVLQIVPWENQDAMQEAYTILEDTGMLPFMMKTEMPWTASELMMQQVA